MTLEVGPGEEPLQEERWPSDGSSCLTEEETQKHTEIYRLVRKAPKAESMHPLETFVGHALMCAPDKTAAQGSPRSTRGWVPTGEECGQKCTGGQKRATGCVAVSR